MSRRRWRPVSPQLVRVQGPGCGSAARPADGVKPSRLLSTPGESSAPGGARQDPRQIGITVLYLLAGAGRPLP